MTNLSLISTSMAASNPKTARWLTLALIASSVLTTTIACSRSRPAQTPEAKSTGEPQRRIVERAATAVTRMRQNERHSDMNAYIERAQAIMIFPRVIKASLLFGGEGGNGVLVSRSADGSWSNPAFYSLGAPSIGLQVGYQEATIVLFIMDKATVERALNSSLTLGSEAGASIGTVGERETSSGAVSTPNVYQLVESGGVYAGVSLDGYVIGARSRHNLEYYGQPRTPREIVVDGRAPRADADVLRRALSTQRSPSANATNG